MSFRPSLLPKLAACARYQPEANAGAAANRGTAMDAAFREIIQGNPDAAAALDEEALASVSWAVDTAWILAGEHPLVAGEENLRIEACGMTGTADLLCPDALWSADLKSGQVRNYREQQAAYALGFMDSHFVEEWTVYLLFCDARVLVTLRFTREEAERLIRGVLSTALDAEAAATPCDYCDWCALRWKCPARLETVAWFLGLDPSTVNLEEAAADPVKLGQTLNLTHLITKDGGVHDTLKAAARQHFEEKHEVPGWKMQSGRETRTVPALALQEPRNGKTILQLAGTQAVMTAIGTMTAAKFEGLWRTAYGDDPIPPGTITTSHGAPFLVKARAKKAA